MLRQSTQEIENVTHIPVVNITLRVKIPSINSVHDSAQNIISIWLFDLPAFWPVRHDVSEDPSSVVAHLMLLKYFFKKFLK